MKILLTFFVFILTISSVFAEIKLIINTDKKEYNIEEDILFRINISSDENSSQLIVNWLDNFQIVWRRQTQSNYNINWVQTSNLNLNLKLLSKKSWEYTLWPVSIKSWTWITSKLITSNTIKIKITWERIMVNNLIVSEDEEVEDKIENLDKVDINPNINNEQKEFIKKKILGIDWKEMTGIYKNKEFIKWDLFSKELIYILFLLIILVILWSISYKYFIKYLLKLNKKLEEKNNVKKEAIKKKINYNKLLEFLEEQYIDSKKEIFYAKLWDLFRIYLDDKVLKWLSKKSFKEFLEIDISWLLDDEKEKIIKIYEKIYYPEYNKKLDEEDRGEIIEEMKNIIINKIK